jgi:Endoplasmic reticulum vesicle transporter
MMFALHFGTSFLGVLAAIVTSFLGVLGAIVTSFLGVLGAIVTSFLGVLGATNSLPSEWRVPPGECARRSSVQSACWWPLQVRKQYQKRGWALMNLVHISQCKDDTYLTSLKDQQGEGCHMWGTLDVNKVAGNFHFAPGDCKVFDGSDFADPWAWYLLFANLLTCRHDIRH